MSDLHAENEVLREKVKTLREDWYKTHDELLVERYKGFERGWARGERVEWGRGRGWGWGCEVNMFRCFVYLWADTD